MWSVWAMDVPVHDLKACVCVFGVEVEHPSFTSPALGRVASSLHSSVFLPSPLLPRKWALGTKLRRCGPQSWSAQRGEEKVSLLPEVELRFLGWPVPSFCWPGWLHVILPGRWSCGRECAGKCWTVLWNVFDVEYIYGFVMLWGL